MLTKPKKFAFRISEADLTAIREMSAQAEMNVTDYLTTCALQKQIVVVDGLPEIVSELKAIGGNLNQLTTLANMGRISCPDLTAVKDVFCKIYAVLLTVSGRKR